MEEINPFPFNLFVRTEQGIPCQKGIQDDSKKSALIKTVSISTEHLSNTEWFPKDTFLQKNIFSSFLCKWYQIETSSQMNQMQIFFSKSSFYRSFDTLELGN